MSRRIVRAICLAPLVVASVALAACDVLAPVVGVRDGGASAWSCLGRLGCDAALPERAAEVRLSELDLPELRCDAESTVFLEVTDDAELPVVSGACLEVVVAPGASEGATVTLTFGGGDIAEARVSITATVPTALTIRRCV